MTEKAQNVSSLMIKLGIAKTSKQKHLANHSSSRQI